MEEILGLNSLSIVNRPLSIRLVLVQLPQFQVHAAIEERHWWFQARRTIMRALLHRVVAPGKNKLLIDIGCGTGGNTVAFASEYECIGIDPVAEAVAFAKNRFPGIRFIQGMAPRDIPEEMKRADIVLLMDVLEHVEDDRGLVRDILAAMKPGSCLLMMAPADKKLWSPHDRGFEHFRRYDLASARMLWADTSAKELVCSYVNSHLYWPIRLVRMFTKLFNRSLGPADTDLSVPPAPINRLLQKLFEIEVRRLVKILEGKKRGGFRHGVSFMALLRKT